MKPVRSDIDFAPIFVVGPGRAGTTMLAVWLDRHSRVAVPPETHFFDRFVPEVWDSVKSSSREEIVRAALCFERIAESQLTFERVLEHFSERSLTKEGLFRAILEAYAAEHGAARSGEKSPTHIRHVADILDAYPGAKVVAIVRDGRDVVRSVMKLDWMQRNPRRFGHFCRIWSEVARMSLDYRAKYPADRYRLVRYEDLVLHPELELQKICQFIGEEFEARQLDPTIETGTVPVREEQWKGKARTKPDPSRIEAWRRSDDKQEICAMNYLMGPMLRRLGYTDTDVKGCPWHKRVKFTIMRIVYSPRAFAIAVFGFRLLRHLRLRVR